MENLDRVKSDMILTIVLSYHCSNNSTITTTILKVSTSLLQNTPDADPEQFLQVSVPVWESWLRSVTVVRSGAGWLLMTETTFLALKTPSVVLYTGTLVLELVLTSSLSRDLTL